ncbi:ATP-grasp domain-containing protein [Dissulfurirhabdus thermomarina]|uniref:ATP-grasp domain-containing protein n=1 Tax=Dissulfurirhabdus thermomarina TaxID=1765737 RepID=A0A6N9TQG6_DISTH|nr:ATP-grasp domain-containing protein [Dissulfurirhabdus thermomarina]NDY43511.1 ATP-grasp domain-containing protein [Dissulfurirhabdus thermomarina]NMX23006.1 ATP-grasp domain-containing protein [Dissulfurirhabdus thermomarina]
MPEPTPNTPKARRPLLLTGRVLVTDGHWTKTVAAVRALGRAGLHVTVGETSRLAAAFFSRHAHRRVVYPSPRTRPRRFLAALERAVRRGDFDVLIPMELQTLLLVSVNRDRFLPHVRFPFAPDPVLRRAASKWHAAEAARRAGLPVPRTRLLPRGTRDWSLLDDPGLPLVLKPEYGEGGRGLYYCRSEEDLGRAFERIEPTGRTYVAQEWIPPGGDPLGVSLLMGPGGRTHARFTHRRLREYPPGGGPSTLREVFRHPAAEAAAERLLAELDFTGVAMVEFKVDPRDGRPVILEVNPRFWGSLPLAVAAGVNFPVLLYRWAVGLPLPKPPTPRPGLKARCLVPGDLLHLVAARGRVSRDFWRLRDPDTRCDLLDPEDPAPFFARLLSLAALPYDPQLKAVLKRREAPRGKLRP